MTFGKKHHNVYVVYLRRSEWGRPGGLLCRDDRL